MVKLLLLECQFSIPFPQLSEHQPYMLSQPWDETSAKIQYLHIVPFKNASFVKRSLADMIKLLEITDYVLKDPRCWIVSLRSCTHGHATASQSTVYFYHC